MYRRNNHEENRQKQSKHAPKYGPDNYSKKVFEIQGENKIGINIYSLLYIKQITNKGLLYSTGNSTQYSVMTYIYGKESKKEWIYVYV